MVYYARMTKIDPADLLTMTQAAERRGTTRQAVSYLVRQGKLEAVEVAGRLFVRRADVDSFTPDTGGRPPKVKAEVSTTVEKPKRAVKKGGRK